ncbi:MAG: hypothetical protein ACTHMI_12355 [Mucilaginibacter sp.]
MLVRRGYAPTARNFLLIVFLPILAPDGGRSDVHLSVLAAPLGAYWYQRNFLLIVFYQYQLSIEAESDLYLSVLVGR